MRELGFQWCGKNKAGGLLAHGTIDEVAGPPDLQKRQWLLNQLAFLGRPIPT
jgi:hypothetical protein